MVQLDCMQGMIAGYVASPRGQEAIRNFLSSPEGKKTINTFLSSPEGKKTINTFLSTPEGQEAARLVLSRALDGLDLPADIRAKVLSALEEKTNSVSKPDIRRG
jgi:hypothetical protein